nr:MAG TPA: hypothetical protein [Caudoviricetes sp.]
MAEVSEDPDQPIRVFAYPHSLATCCRSGDATGM